MPPMSPQPALTIQFLSWIAAKSRTYDDTMEAWRTSCPRLTIWEDAVSDGLIAFRGDSAMRDRTVVLTERGYTALNAHRAALNGYELISRPQR
jgi:hypothetical protein